MKGLTIKFHKTVYSNVINISTRYMSSCNKAKQIEERSTVTHYFKCKGLREFTIISLEPDLPASPKYQCLQLSIQWKVLMLLYYCQDSRLLSQFVRQGWSCRQNTTIFSFLTTTKTDFHSKVNQCLFAFLSSKVNQCLFD